MNPPKKSRVFMTLAIGTSLLLGACGGGSGGGASKEDQNIATPEVTSFDKVKVAEGFDWKTSQSINPALTIRRADNAFLGEGWTVSLTDYACSDAALGDYETPVATSQYLRLPLSNGDALLTQARLEIGALQLPAGKSDVLVEVYRANSVHYSRRHAVKDLAKLTVTLPTAPPSTANTADRAYLDLCR
jgi:hypothetical protein